MNYYTRSFRFSSAPVDSYTYFKSRALVPAVAAVAAPASANLILSGDPPNAVVTVARV